MGKKNNQAKASEIRVWVWRVLAHGKTLAADSKPSEEGENTAGLSSVPGLSRGGGKWKARV